MPLSNEKVVNKALAGPELITVILNDIRTVLERDGLLSQYVAYRQIAYSVEIKLQTGNPLYPEHSIKVKAGTTEPFQGEPPIAKPEGEQGRMNKTLKRKIDSPNLTRMDNGMPITQTTFRGGRLVTEEVQYEKGDYPAPSPLEVTDNETPTSASR